MCFGLALIQIKLYCLLIEVLTKTVFEYDLWNPEKWEMWVKVQLKYDQWCFGWCRAALQLQS